MSNKIFNKKKIYFLTGVTLYGLLGFKRGMNHYDYRHKKYMGRNDKPYLYSSRICNGFIAIFLYINPFLAPFIISKEIYRLEVNIRNIENEKNTDYYNEL